MSNGDFTLCNPGRNAVCVRTDDGLELTWRELTDASRKLAKSMPPRSLVFCLCGNSLGSLCGYAGFITARHVPLMLETAIDSGLLGHLIQIYRPLFLWLPEPMIKNFPEYEEVMTLAGYALLRTGLMPYSLHEDLALLITTSGSTGSPRLIRQSYANLRSNTESIVEYLEISPEDRAVTTLPMNYVYGLSIINTHLFRGASILLTGRSVLEEKFWTFCQEQRATSFGGVPYTYEMLKRCGFLKMDLPDLRYFTQAGGKLPPELHLEFARYAADTDKRFYVMYGASEATARMGYLPYPKAVEKKGSMGIAIPGGEFSLVDGDGASIAEPDIDGELVYRGANICLGYAQSGEDLALGDGWKGVLHTGDMARRDAEGYYYIVGRKARFVKIAGKRISLDEVEQLIKTGFPGLVCACGGIDENLFVFVETSPVSLPNEPRESERRGQEKFGNAVKKFISAKSGINYVFMQVVTLAELPKNAAGKILYAELAKYYSGGAGSS